jgi:hypothetical protein
MFPATVPVFKCGHDPSTPQDHPGHKERAALGMTAEEEEDAAGLGAGDCKAGLGVCDREAVEARYGCATRRPTSCGHFAAGCWGLGQGWRRAQPGMAVPQGQKREGGEWLARGVSSERGGV